MKCAQQLIEEVRSIIHKATRFGAEGLEWTSPPQVILGDIILAIVREEGNVVVILEASGEVAVVPVTDDVCLNKAEVPGVTAPYDASNLEIIAHLAGNVLVRDTSGHVYAVQTVRDVHTDQRYMLRCMYVDGNGSFWVGGGAAPHELTYQEACGQAMTRLLNASSQVGEVTLFDCPMGASSAPCQIWRLHKVCLG